MKYFSIACKIAEKSRFVAIILMFLISSIEASATSSGNCAAGNYQVNKSVILVTDKLFSGQYDDFINFIGRSIIVSPKDRKELMDPLKKYFPNGFDNCRFIGGKDNSNEIKSYLVEFEADGNSIFFYAVALAGSKKFRRGIVIFHVSTDFSELFELWK